MFTVRQILAVEDAAVKQQQQPDNNRLKAPAYMGLIFW